MSERTDQEEGTEPETVADWKRDNEGNSDTPPAFEPPPTSEAGQDARPAPVDAGGAADPTAPPPTSEAGSPDS